MDDASIIDALLKYEGGYVDHPDDRGGPTNFGITIADLRLWRAPRPVTKDDVRQMTVEEARQIFQSWYIEKPGFGRIPDGYLKWILVDSGVLHGTRTATKWLQQAVGATMDGVIGNETFTALAAADSAHVARQVLGARFRKYPAIIKANPSQLVFLEGWINRATSLLVGA